MKKSSQMVIVAILAVLICAPAAFASTSGGIDQLDIVKAIKKLITLLQYLAAATCVFSLAATAFCFVRGGEASQWVSSIFSIALIAGTVWGGTAFVEWMFGGTSGATVDVLVSMLKTPIMLS